MIAHSSEKSILLVDDEADIREVLAISLADLGYAVSAAANGQEALQTFSTLRPEIVLTDIKMPVMDGIELLRRIKRENPDTEVIMITGHGDMDLAIESLKHQATDFITKPINVEALEIALSRTCEKIVMRKQLKEYTENLERLISEKSALQDHLSSLGLMLGSISHGLKGLLTNLDGGMYLVESGFKKEDRQQIQEGWDTVKLMVDRIRKMVLDILYYAKERDLKWEKVDAFSFAEEVAKVTAPKIESQGIDFVRDFDATAGQFEIDPGYVHSALINILENAQDACAKDTARSCHQIVFSVRQDKSHIIFTIQDNGIGMDEATKEKLFTLFFSSKARKGTGLGLFISHKIIQQHGGTISVQSKPGNGATFKVRIPKMPAKSGGSAP